MSTKILSFQKKLRIIIFSILTSVLLMYFSQNLNLNEKSQRLLVKLLNVPQQFLTQVLNEYKDFENQQIAILEKEILNLKNQIYESELKIKSLENSNPSFNYEFSRIDSSEIYINSFDQMNFTCCNKHRIFVNNPNNINEGIYAISQGNFVIGKTKNITNNEIEVRLLSDPTEYISIKNTNGFYCIARGTGKGRFISCLNESKAVSYSDGDTFFTTGFDGLYPPGLVVGRLIKISTNQSNIFEQRLEIKLFFDPYQSINKKVILHE